MSNLNAVVLAAGAGTRMKSKYPKPLHEICGRPMVSHMLVALDELPVEKTIVVIGYGADEMKQRLADHRVNSSPIEFAVQQVQKGTGHAVEIALTAMSEASDDDEVIVLPGDMPLLRAESLVGLLDHHRYTRASATVMTVEPEDPSGYGRIIRDRHGRVRKIVEQADASPEQLQVKEVNTSVYCFNLPLLRAALRKVESNNAQGEIYLTDAIELLANAGHIVETMRADEVSWAVGVNDRSQLAIAETEIRRRINNRVMNSGVSLVDPASTYIDSDATLDVDVRIMPNTRIVGNTKIASGAIIGPNTELTNCHVGQSSILSNVIATDAIIGADAKVGPYAVIQTGGIVQDGEETGSFITIERSAK